MLLHVLFTKSRNLSLSFPLPCICLRFVMGRRPCVYETSVVAAIVVIVIVVVVVVVLVTVIVILVIRNDEYLSPLKSIKLKQELQVFSRKWN